MSRDELVKVFSDFAQVTIDENIEAISEMLTCSIKDDMNTDQVLAHTIGTSISVITQCTVQILIYGLCELGVINEDGYKLEEKRPDLKLIWDADKRGE